MQLPVKSTNLSQTKVRFENTPVKSNPKMSTSRVSPYKQPNPMSRYNPITNPIPLLGESHNKYVSKEKQKAKDMYSTDSLRNKIII